MSKEQFKSGYVALIGEANAGKSTLLNRLLGTKLSIVSPKSHTTRHKVQGIKTTANAQIIFVDTPGFLQKIQQKALNRLMRDSIYEALADVDLKVLVIDVGQAVKLGELGSVVQKQLEKFEVRHVDVIALNKIDLIKRDLLLPMIASLSTTFTAEIVPISATSGDGVEILERVLVEKLPHGPQYFPEEIITDQPFAVTIGELVREKLYYYLQQELPYSSTVRVDEYYENEGVLHVFASILVERDSQKAIVIGAKGATLKKIGTSARKDLERITKKRVNLQLHVKVEPQWTRTESGLKKAGAL